jgi:hypothetical protein
VLQWIIISATLVHTLYHEFHYRGLTTASSSADYNLRLLDGSGSELSSTAGMLIVAHN